MHTLDEWKILVNTVKRRVERGDKGPEEEMILAIDRVLEYTLGEGCDHETHKRCFTAISEMLDAKS